MGLWTHSTSTVVDSVGSIGAPVDITINGIAPQLDDTDKIAASIYGTNEEAGDTAIRVNAAGESRSSSESKLLLEDLLIQMKLMNLYLSSIVGDEFSKLDLER